jgi:methylenetetrahydrofolate dehydrogenase (NAD+)
MSNKSNSSNPGRTILASSIAKPFIDEIAKGVELLGRKPLLVGFLANDDPHARMYAEWTGKTSEELGFSYELRVLDKEELEEAVIEANNDDKVDGIMIYFPVFNNRQDQYLQQVLSPEKDVEGLSHIYIQNMYQNIRFLDKNQTQKSILPCTPLAIVKILEHLRVYNSLIPYGNRLYGKTITIVNRSEIVGRPLAALLANDGATVYSFDITGAQRFTRGEGIKAIKHHVADIDNVSLKEAALQSDVVVTGVPSSEYTFPTEYIKSGAVCINFSSDKNFATEVKERASLYVPSIGKVTIAMLLRNLLRLIDNKAIREGGSK